MKRITLSQHRLLTSISRENETGDRALWEIDQGMHEILVSKSARGSMFALLLMKHTLAKKRLAWCDPAGELWPANLISHGIALDRLLILRPRKSADILWAMTECLRCPAIGVTIGSVDRLSQIEARRLQLASERGNSVGLLIRPESARHSFYSASTRWLVKPARGDALTQRWTIQLIHGQGGHVGRSILLEVTRETNRLHPSEIVPNRSTQTKVSINSA